jgi:CheY-like chemotaxis protein
LAIAKTTSLDAALIGLNNEKDRTSGDHGLELVAALRRQLPNLPIVVMTAWSSIDLAIDAMRRGARDFVEKPWDDARLTTVLRGQAELGHALRRVNELEDEVRQLRGLSPAGRRRGRAVDAADGNGSDAGAEGDGHASGKCESGRPDARGSAGRHIEGSTDTRSDSSGSGVPPGSLLVGSPFSGSLP